MSTVPRMFQRARSGWPSWSAGGGYRLSMAARSTPSPPREWPTSRTRERSAFGPRRTAAGAVEVLVPQSAQRARWERTSDERAWAPPSSRSPSWPLMPLAEIETVT